MRIPDGATVFHNIWDEGGVGCLLYLLKTILYVALEKVKVKKNNNKQTNIVHMYIHVGALGGVCKEEWLAVTLLIGNIGSDVGRSL